MKGLVFTELLNMAEDAVGEEMVDDVIDSCPLESGGAYSSVGNYDCSELVSLVGGFSDRTGLSVDKLQNMFGRWMLARFVDSYPAFFETKTNAFDMLDSIENEVHVEVRKLYPDAELPTFRTERPSSDVFVFIYSSPRRLMAFCHGLIEACLEHYNETATIEVEDQSTEELGIARFTLTKTA